MVAKFDLLVYMALVFILVVFLAVTWVLRTTEEVNDMEVRKVRFSASMFVGILITVLFVSILHYAHPSEASAEIFEKVMTAITPLAGAMMGYLFGARSSSN